MCACMLENISYVGVLVSPCIVSRAALSILGGVEERTEDVFWHNE